MSDSTAYMITDALLYAVNSYRNIGGGVNGVQLAAKTGTSNFSTEARRTYGYPSSANMDMWVTGYTPEYAVSLWYGYTEAERGYYLGSEGYSTRGKLFRQVISGISDRSGSKTFTIPGSVVKATIEKETSPSLLPSGNTPGDMRVTEYFKRGTQPTEVSPRYNTLPNASGLNAKENGSQIELTWNGAAKPAYLTDEGLKKSLSGLYGKKVDEAVANRKASDGEYGYEVLAVDTATGATTSLGFTTSTAMKVTKPTKTTTYYVKTCMSNMRITQSSGISIEVKGTGSSSGSGESGGGKSSSTLITYRLNGNSNDTATVNTTYTDPGIIVYSEGTDITSSARVTVTCAKLGSSKGQKESYTFTEAGTYTLTYKIEYSGESETTTRTITVTDPNASNDNNQNTGE